MSYQQIHGGNFDNISIMTNYYCRFIELGTHHFNTKTCTFYDQSLDNKSTIKLSNEMHQPEPAGHVISMATVSTSLTPGEPVRELCQLTL